MAVVRGVGNALHMSAHCAKHVIVLQMREADKGRSGKRKGRGDTAADDADPLQEAGGKRYFKKKY